MSTTNPEVVESVEYGYRLPDGAHVWQVDHGTDGTWIPARRFGGKLIPAIDVNELKSHMETTQQIALVLQSMINGGYVMAREVRMIRDAGPIEWAEVAPRLVVADV